MEHAANMTLIAVLSGSSILIHCRQGKRRNRAFGCFMYVLLCGCSTDEALWTCKDRNRRLQGHDVRLVMNLIQEWVDVGTRPFL